MSTNLSRLRKKDVSDSSISGVDILQNMLTITLGLPSSAKRATVGLTGTFDDDQENDLTYLNGTGHISANSTESEIFEWASTCELCIPIISSL